MTSLRVTDYVLLAAITALSALAALSGVPALMLIAIFINLSLGAWLLWGEE